jgi:hypothetical protein
MIEYARLVGREVVPAADVHEAFGGQRAPKVGDDRIGEAHISTVFLRLNHGYTEDSPLWFETMIFGGEHDQFCDRYTTYDQAEAGHKRVVAALKAGLSPDSAGGKP